MLGAPPYSTAGAVIPESSTTVPLPSRIFKDNHFEPSGPSLVQVNTAIYEVLLPVDASHQQCGAVTSAALQPVYNYYEK